MQWLKESWEESRCRLGEMSWNKISIIHWDWRRRRRRWTIQRVRKYFAFLLHPHINFPSPFLGVSLLFNSTFFLYFFTVIMNTLQIFLSENIFLLNSQYFLVCFSFSADEHQFHVRYPFQRSRGFFSHPLLVLLFFGEKYSLVAKLIYRQ